MVSTDFHGPFVWPAPPDAADITPERYMAFRPRRLMTDQAWLSVEPAFSTQSGRWFARLHELAGERADVPQLLAAVASDGYAHLAMAETLDLPEGEAQNLIPGQTPTCANSPTRRASTSATTR